MLNGLTFRQESHTVDFMQSSTQMFAVDGQSSVPARRSSLQAEGLWETTHLERWVVDHPEILGENVLIVATQYDKWSSESGTNARERLDILALDSSGQLIVVELKRGSDPRVHLQALTYAALVSTFTKQSLAHAHAAYVNGIDAEGTRIDHVSALSLLDDHVADDWDVDLLTQPKIVLIAEDFPAQVLTTVSWITGIAAGKLEIELHIVNLFVLDSGAGQTCAVFQRLFPVEDLEPSLLSAGASDSRSAEISERIFSRKRQARTVSILVSNNLVPAGGRVTLNLEGMVRPEVREQVQNWAAENPDRTAAQWVTDPTRPLRWLADSMDRTWAPTSLIKHIIAEATQGNPPGSIHGPFGWEYLGQRLTVIANKAKTED